MRGRPVYVERSDEAVGVVHGEGAGNDGSRYAEVGIVEGGGGHQGHFGVFRFDTPALGQDGHLGMEFPNG